MARGVQVAIDHELVVQMLRNRKTKDHICERVGCGRSTLEHYMQAHGLKQEPHRVVGGDSVRAAAPSLAMIRLAEFDPVIRRALNIKMGRGDEPLPE